MQNNKLTTTIAYRTSTVFINFVGSVVTGYFVRLLDTFIGGPTYFFQRLASSVHTII
jgi:hypothetical protein